ncbi:MAG: D-lysine 5,6-aminomutase subunit alpha, partial [Bacteroidales bacterium]|nr:D-lysine 5,6-aminomutase subunit alpha [Bacteroidales bacterium]
MNTSKVGLDFEKVEYARGKAREIANQVQDFVENYTTVAVERTLCRLLGIDGIDSNDVPLPNVVVEELKSKGVLNQGVMFYIGNAMVETK